MEKSPSLVVLATATAVEQHCSSSSLSRRKSSSDLTHSLLYYGPPDLRPFHSHHATKLDLVDIPGDVNNTSGLHTSDETMQLAALSVDHDDNTLTLDLSNLHLANDDSDSTMNSLADLTALLQEQKYQTSKASNLASLSRQLSVNIAKTQRLISFSRDVRRLLTEALRNEDKSSFASLYNVFQDGCRSITSHTSPDLQRHDVDVLHRTSIPARTSILTLLTKLRYDGAYLATQLSNLSHKQLATLLPDAGTTRSAASVLNNNSGPSQRDHYPVGFATDRLMEDLAGSSTSCPLNAIIRLAHGDIFLNQDGITIATDVWSTVCARLIQDERPGSEKIVPHLLDVWSATSPWYGQEQLELWMLDTLHNGAFLLQQSKTFSQRTQITPDLAADQNRVTEQFFEDATTNFLDLCRQQDLASIIPAGALLLCHATAAKLDQNNKYGRGFASFVAARWLFMSFIPSLLLLPESHGMLHGQFISEIARNRIFKEINSRIQRIGLNVAYGWRQYGAASERQIKHIQQIIAKFDRPRISGQQKTTARQISQSCRAIYGPDLISTIDSIFPARTAASVCSDTNTLRSGLRSSASSISGFSVFHNYDSIAGSETDGQQGSRGLSIDTNLPEVDNITDARDELADHLHAVDTASWTIIEVFDDKQEILIPREILASTLDNVAVNAPSWWSTLLSLSEDVDMPQQFSANQHTMPIGLASAYEARISRCVAEGNFDAVQEWTTSYNGLKKHIENDGEPRLANLISNTSVHSRASIATSTTQIAMFEAAIKLNDRLLGSATTTISQELERLQSLRDKMWYTTSLRHSALFEDLQGTVSALHMIGRTKTGAIRPLPTNRLSSTSKSNNFMHRTNAQIVGILSAEAEYGGPNKLTTEQSRIVWQWLAQNQIGLPCKAEERIHKMCMELRRCVEQSTNPSRQDNPSLWADMLFLNEQNNILHPEMKSSRLGNISQVSRTIPPAFQAVWSAQHDLRSPASQTLSHASSSEIFDVRSPTLTSRSSYNFWSPAPTETRSNSSATSIGSNGPDACLRVNVKARTAGLTRPDMRLSQRITGLLVSELSFQLFRDGSETDQALFQGLGGRLFSQVNDNAQDVAQVGHGQEHTGFDVITAVTRTIKKFTATANPCSKLQLLSTLQKLLPKFMRQKYGQKSACWNSSDHFLALFRDSNLRPQALFRDLQFIATLVPSSLLMKDAYGDGFANACAAAYDIKSEIICRMIETADGIIRYHTSNRGHSRSASTAQHQRDSATFALPKDADPSIDFSTYTMADAGELLQITAREGHAAAQRELATLYLTHPDLMSRIIAPFALPKEVFREELESKWKSQDRARCDPLTMCVAHHWMLLSSRGGDALAKEYLRQREEMERLP